jgi:protein SCO1/2
VANTLSFVARSRTRLVLVVVALLALGGAVAVTLAERSADEGGPAADVTEVGAKGPRSPFEGALRPPARVRDFSLRDQDGRLVSLHALRGRIVVLSPMYTHCRDSCPLVAQQIRDVLGDLPSHERDKVTALALSVDPANDSAESAKSFLLKQRVRGYLDFLVGSRSELEPVWRAYGFSAQTDRREHNSYVVLIDRRGRQRVGFPIGFLTPESLLHDLRVLIEERA